MNTTTLNPDLRSALIEQGWGGIEMGPHLLIIGALYGNKKHRHLYLEVLGADKVRLYIHLDVRACVPTLKAQTINTARRNWSKSLTRWVSLACLALQDVWEREDNQNALEELKERRRREMLAALVEPIGVTVEEFETLAKIDWEWINDSDIPTKAPEIAGLRLNKDGVWGPPTANWDGATRVRKAARLLTFLMQEEWR